MYPGQPPGNAEPRLIEVRPRGGGDRLPHPPQYRSHRTGDPRDHCVTAPGETGTPNNCAIAWQVRPRDRNWPCHR